jgi:hypothetical protein
MIQNIHSLIYILVQSKTMTIIYMTQYQNTHKLLTDTIRTKQHFSFSILLSHQFLKIGWLIYPTDAFIFLLHGHALPLTTLLSFRSLVSKINS